MRKFFATHCLGTSVYSSVFFFFLIHTSLIDTGTYYVLFNTNHKMRLSLLPYGIWQQQMIYHKYIFYTITVVYFVVSIYTVYARASSSITRWYNESEIYFEFSEPHSFQRRHRILYVISFRTFSRTIIFPRNAIVIRTKIPKTDDNLVFFFRERHWVIKIIVK